jgi:hypothetical protein
MIRVITYLQRVALLIRVFQFIAPAMMLHRLSLVKEKESLVSAFKQYNADYGLATKLFNWRMERYRLDVLMVTHLRKTPGKRQNFLAFDRL